MAASVRETAQAYYRHVAYCMFLWTHQNDQKYVTQKQRSPDKKADRFLISPNAIWTDIAIVVVDKKITRVYNSESSKFPVGRF